MKLPIGNDTILSYVKLIITSSFGMKSCITTRKNSISTIMVPGIERRMAIGVQRENSFREKGTEVARADAETIKGRRAFFSFTSPTIRIPDSETKPSIAP